MAKRRKTRKKSNSRFSFFSKKKKKSSRSKKTGSSLSSGLKIVVGIVVVCLLIAGAAFGFLYLEQYVKASRSPSQTYGRLVLKDPGSWVNEEWEQKVRLLIGSGPFPLDDAAAAAIAQKLRTLSWMENVRVQVTPEQIEVTADYRRPVGLVDLGREKFYLDSHMTVMDYIPVNAMPIAEITGIASPRSIPSPGNRWAAEDALAAVQILDMLYKMDLHFQDQQQLEKPLLDEIRSIDVSNFAARKNNSEPHIVLTVKDGTEIRWGAAWGEAGRYLEQDEKDKLTDLYQFYMDHNNTLAGTAKYIELRQL